MLTRRPLYIREVEIHMMVNLSKCRLALCCASPLLEDKLCKLIVTEELTGSAYSVPMVISPACSCLYLKLHVPMWMSFLFDSENDELIFFFLVRKPCKSSTDQNRVTFLWMESVWHAVHGWRHIQFHVAQVSQHMKGCKIICTNLFFFIYSVIPNK